MDGKLFVESVKEFSTNMALYMANKLGEVSGTDGITMNTSLNLVLSCYLSAIMKTLDFMKSVCERENDSGGEKIIILLMEEVRKVFSQIENMEALVPLNGRSIQ